jgi:predicted phage terminase large subunit-like protein
MLSRPEAAAELLRRRLAIESLVEFSQQVDIPGRPLTDQSDEDRFNAVETPIAAHHQLLMETLQRIAETPNGRVMVFMPPGSAKSTYASVVFPAWFLGRCPGKQVILASYATNLAKKHGRRTRQLVATPRYREIFETTLAKDQSAANEWALTNNSEYMAGGILAGLTGNRADGLIVDDPVAGRDEAESEVIRAKTKDAYNDDARTRLKPGGWRALIQTRWHEDDLAGSILPEKWAGESGPILCRDGHVWEIICLPAECDRSDDPLGRALGEGLWPEWFTPGHWDEFKSSPRSWLSLYQQKPTAEQGSFFKREWLKSYDRIPESLTVYMSGDFAVSEDKGDFTELAVWGVDPNENVYMLDWWYGQTTPDAWINALLSKSDRWKPLWFIGEGGVIRRSVEPFLNKEMQNQRIYVATEWLASSHDKPSQARSFQALCSAGKVYFPKSQDAERVIDQLLRFPSARYDDAVDACSLFGRFIDRTWKAVPKPVKKEIDWNAPPRIMDFEPPRFGEERYG